MPTRIYVSNCVFVDRNADVLKWLRTLQDHFHRPPTLNRDPENGGLDICITPGCQDALCKVSNCISILIYLRIIIYQFQSLVKNTLI